MSIFLIKIIAAFFMVVDHIKYAIPSCWNEFTLYFGRIAFPLFAFCTVQGYIHTRDFNKYITRLLIAGFISEIPFLLFNSLPDLNVTALNIEFTLILGLLAIKAYEKNKCKGLIILILLGILANCIRVDYGMFGVLLIFSFYIFKDNKLKTVIASGLVISGKYLYRGLILNIGFTDYIIKNWICTLIPLLMIFLYNGKKGPNLKWFFYIFYPLHLLILYLISPYTNLINF